ncbi:MAG: NADP-dependent isocitrate dehydrogenase [Saprospiraceae bacterium]
MRPKTSATVNPGTGQETPVVTIAYGDGIGKEIMTATLQILEAAGARINYETIQIGKEVYLQGITSGIAEEAWDVLRRNKVFLKAPITTPQGGGYKSLNVTMRKALGLYANVRPVKAYAPYVECQFPQMDLVVIRENEEDLYAGIEHQQTGEVVQCLKLVSRPGCEKVIRYAFEYARANGRKKVTCMTKDNIMKLTDGLFHQVFNEIAPEYPDIQTDHYIIDIGSALLADKPDHFDVVVTLNLYGDIISDITAQVAGSVGLGGSANIGEDFAMFEAIHGSAPDIADKDIANPSGLLNAACMMLVHLGQPQIAEKIQNAWLKALEDGVHTGDIYNESFTTQKVGTRAFAQAVIERLGQEPERLAKIHYPATARPIQVKISPSKPVQKKLVGIDVFLDWSEEGRDPNKLGAMLEALSCEKLKLKMITNRGVKVYPGGLPETFCTDHWRCRFVSVKSHLTENHDAMDVVKHIHYTDIVDLLTRFTKAGLNFIKTENLYEINGKPAYSLGQGE